MGLFNTISERVRRGRERRKAASGLRGYVDPALVEYVLSNPDAGRLPLRSGEVEFVLALLDDDMSRLPESLGQAMAELRKNGAWMEGVSSSLVFATFGTVLERNPTDARQQRTTAAAQLHERLGERVRIVHGSVVGIVGDVVSAPDRCLFHFGSGLRGFNGLLTVLVSLRAGEIREVTPGKGDAETAAE